MSKPTSKKNFWFTDKAVPFYQQGVKAEIFIKKVLHEERSKYQHIQIMETYDFGRALILDGILQTSEADEFIYHEMLALMPCLLVEKAREVLIIGGGDGGSLREVLRIKSLKKVILSEIDERVVRVSEEYLPSLSAGAFKNPKGELVFGDGIKLIRQYTNQFDVIILDLSDPFSDSLSEPLYKEPFFKEIKKALKKDGILTLQAESLIFSSIWVRNLVNIMKKVFPYITIHTANIPTYLVCQFCFISASDKSLEAIKVEELKKRYKNVVGKVKYLSPQIYVASKVVPPYFK